MTEGIRYYAAEEVTPMEWKQQVTIFGSKADAKFYALKLYCSTTGVIVKAVEGGFLLSYWRRQTAVA